MQNFLKNPTFVCDEISRLGCKYLAVLYLCERFINDQS